VCPNVVGQFSSFDTTTDCDRQTDRHADTDPQPIPPYNVGENVDVPEYVQP